MTEARLGFVVVRVRDVAASAWFYREAFDVPFGAGEQGQLSAEAAWKEGVNLRLLLRAEEQTTPSIELGFFVDDLEAAHARAVGAGAEVVRTPRDERSARTAAYLDPDGNVVTLTQRPRALRVAGVDLAGGALAVVVLEENRIVEAFRCETFADALLVEARVVAVNVPIGTPDAGERAADAAARQYVGPNESIVFTTSISARSSGLRRRILEVEEYAHRDERVIEVHPEVSFRELAHRPLPSRNRLEGLAERRALLEQAGIELPAAAPRIAEPDLLDATVAAWSARRYALGEALPLPEGHSARIGAIWR